jgi:hypothetical protein
MGSNSRRTSRSCTSAASRASFGGVALNACSTAGQASDLRSRYSRAWYVDLLVSRRRRFAASRTIFRHVSALYSLPTGTPTTTVPLSYDFIAPTTVRARPAVAP